MVKLKQKKKTNKQLKLLNIKTSQLHYNNKLKNIS